MLGQTTIRNSRRITSIVLLTVTSFWRHSSSHHLPLCVTYRPITVSTLSITGCRRC